MKRLLTNKIFLILIILILIALVIIFKIANTESKPSKNTSLSITYIKSKDIELANITKGLIYSNKIIVKNTTEKNLYYSIKWENINNTFKEQNKLLYKLDTHDSDALFIGSSQLPIAGYTLSKKVLIKKGLTHTYELTINYKGDIDKEKSSIFKGRLEITPKN